MDDLKKLVVETVETEVTEPEFKCDWEEQLGRPRSSFLFGT